MKIRQGFVSNSSSSSFTVQKDKLSGSQLKALLDYTTSEENLDAWLIRDCPDSVVGFTIMDNGSIEKLIDDLEMTNIQWEYHS